MLSEKKNDLNFLFNLVVVKHEQKTFVIAGLVFLFFILQRFYNSKFFNWKQYSELFRMIVNKQIREEKRTSLFLEN